MNLPNASKFSVSITALAVSLLMASSCSTIANKIFGRKAVPEFSDQAGQELKVDTASRYEWAVQHYESGQYEVAIDGFKAYEHDGASLAGFPLAPYYLGMSHYQLGHYKEAKNYLRNYIEANPGAAQSQDARITLMDCLERESDWKTIVTVAAECDHFPIYVENRIRQKLVWTRALFELHEISGAKHSLQEAENLVNNFTRDPDRLPELSQSNDDFQARLFLLHTILELEDCEALLPPTKPGKKMQILVDRWIETKGDCLLATTRHALDLGLGFTGDQADRWLTTLGTYFDRYTNSPKQLVKLKLYANANDASSATRGKLRAALYRIAAAIDSKLKEKRASTDTQQALVRLQKNVENLLLQLSLLS